MSDEDKAVLVEEQKKTLQLEEKARQKTASATIAEQEARAIDEKASITPEKIEAAAQVDEKLVEANELKRIQENAIKQATREKVKAKKAEQNAITSTDDLSDSLKSKMAKFGIRLGKFVAPPAAFALSTLAAKETKADVTRELTELGLPGPVSEVGGAIAGATEYLPVAPSDIIAAGQSMASPVADPGSARPIERMMSDQPELFESMKP